MPIIETKAKLWQPTKEERDAYDEMMISNIELKSLDFEDENFSPVFNRTKQEYFLQHSEKYMNDLSRVMRPLRAVTPEQAVDKYMTFKPNHTYWRDWTITKFFGSFALGYLVLREIPVRNFYARCFIMYAFLAKLADHMNHILPYHGGLTIYTAKDQWTLQDVSNYHQLQKIQKYTEIPTAMNKLRESKLWYSRQPGHLERMDFDYGPHYFGYTSRHRREAHWDGTFNQPLHRLADPQHKDAHMIHWF